MASKARIDRDVDDIVKVRRRQGRALETRHKIMQAALVEFSESGFEGSTTRSIAERANVPHGLVIYHFETKLGIWQTVIEAAFRELHEQLATRLAELRGADAETKMRALFRHFIEMQVNNPELGWLFSHEVSGNSSRLHWLLDQIRGQDIDIALELIRELQAAGRFVEGNPAHLHFLFVGAATRVFALVPEIEHRVGRSPFDPAFVEQHIALCEALFFRGPPRPAP